MVSWIDVDGGWECAVVGRLIVVVGGLVDLGWFSGVGFLGWGRSSGVGELVS